MSKTFDREDLLTKNVPRDKNQCKIIVDDSLTEIKLADRDWKGPNEKYAFLK